MYYRLSFFLLLGISVIALVLLKAKLNIMLFNEMASPKLLYGRSLPANHQLAAEDIDILHQDTNRRSIHDSLNNFIGLHLMRPRDAASLISSTDLSIQPLIPSPGRDSVVLLMPLGPTEEPWLQLLDAGACIELADIPHPF
jgi:hypothetical protein